MINNSHFKAKYWVQSPYLKKKKQQQIRAEQLTGKPGWSPGQRPALCPQLPAAPALQTGRGKCLRAFPAWEPSLQTTGITHLFPHFRPRTGWERWEVTEGPTGPNDDSPKKARDSRQQVFKHVRLTQLHLESPVSSGKEASFPIPALSLEQRPCVPIAWGPRTTPGEPEWDSVLFHSRREWKFSFWGKNTCPMINARKVYLLHRNLFHFIWNFSVALVRLTLVDIMGRGPYSSKKHPRAGRGSGGRFFLKILKP